MTLIRVKFPGSNRPVEYEAGELAVKTGDTLVVESDRGPALATAFEVPPEPAEAVRDKPRVVRAATSDDLSMRDKVKDEEALAFSHGKQAIERRRLPMKLVAVESNFDRSKMVFFFTAEERVDFRELVRELAHRFHTRIEMLQIGVRDAAKKLGGYDVCGRPLCCSTFLRGFDPVTIKMAKDQNLAMNPSKVSGVCGRLKCCLRYEHDLYVSFSKGLPKVGKRCEVPDGRMGRVNRHDPINNVVLVRLEESEEILPFPPEQVKRVTPKNDEVQRAGEKDDWTPVGFEKPEEPKEN